MNAMFLKFFVISIIYTATVNAAKECYFCNSTEHPCNDPFDDTMGTQVACKNLDYSSDPRTRSSTKFMLQNTAMAGVYRKMESEKRSIEDLQEFKCVKARFRSFGQEHLIRTCAPIEPTIASTCDFIRQELDTENFKVLSCYESEKDFSNDAFALQLPAFISMITLAVILQL